ARCPSLWLVVPPSTGIYARSCSPSRLILVFSLPPNTEHYPTKQAQAFLIQCRPIPATAFCQISSNLYIHNNIIDILRHFIDSQEISLLTDVAIFRSIVKYLI
ncbi:hypothetical protein TorRG33x02_044040, partial [Trema orientale]